MASRRSHRQRASSASPAMSMNTGQGKTPLTTNPVLAAHPWSDNSQLIAAAAQLGHLKPEWRTFDATYGKGVFWKLWRPDVLITNDSDWKIEADYHFDFRSIAFPDAAFDAVMFDPPYVCVGGRTTTGIPEMHDRYGLTTAPKSPEGLLAMNKDGLTELVRITKPRGHVLIKYQDQISSGKYFAGTHFMAQHALDLGCTWVDRLERTQPTSRTQPPHARQLHARRNLSTLLVFAKGKS